MPEKFNIDAGENGDWIKQSWDLPDDVNWVLHNCILQGDTDPKNAQGHLDSFMKTRTGRLMPPLMRKQLEHMGLKVSS